MLPYSRTFTDLENVLLADTVPDRCRFNTFEKTQAVLGSTCMSIISILVIRVKQPRLAVHRDNEKVAIETSMIGIFLTSPTAGVTANVTARKHKYPTTKYKTRTFCGH